jgi:DMSO reductase anchor subunit
MHPAFSVLVFTVMSGAGYGLITLMVLGHMSGFAPQEDSVLIGGGVLALVMITVGLLSSTLH